MVLNPEYTVPQRPVASIVKRAVAVAGVILYLAAIAGFLLQSVVGDSAFFPLSYFFTWDMFPAHNTKSLRRVAVGKTASGRFVHLHPSPREQFRAGMEHDFTRIDLEGRGFFYHTAVEKTAQAASASNPSDPVEHVYLFENYRPAKFNYPPALYEAWSGTPKPNRTAWRLAEEFDVRARRLPATSSGGDGQ
jgi:hypothetical protein